MKFTINAILTPQSTPFKIISYSFVITIALLLWNCKTEENPQGNWDFKLVKKEKLVSGEMQINKSPFGHEIQLKSEEWGTWYFKSVKIQENELTAKYQNAELSVILKGKFSADHFIGQISEGVTNFQFEAIRQEIKAQKIDRQHIQYILQKEDISETEHKIDHIGIIKSLDREAIKRGGRIYNSNCINCHGNLGIEGSIPLSTKFWSQPAKYGYDSYTMYSVLTKGAGSMPPQMTLTPKAKYDVIAYIQQNLIRKNNIENYVPNTVNYLLSLPKGDYQGPDAKPYHPWSDMDYGNFFINTYELVDEKTGLERYHSPGPPPYPDEDFSKNNFAYKGIAVRLDPGTGGVAKGKSWMIFDHDLMRVAGGWTGTGFIDWNAILLNDKHETHPRTIGKLHFETPVGPGWANPSTGSFEDTRWKARDGRAFGPLPKKWANYKGLYHFDDKVILSYSVGDSDVLEQLGMQNDGETTIFTRTINMTSSVSPLKMRVAPLNNQVAIKGKGGILVKENGFHVLTTKSSEEVRLKLFIANNKLEELDISEDDSDDVEDLIKYTKKGGKPHFPQILKSTITQGIEKGPFVIDKLIPPFDNPWQARMKLSGIDFMKDGNIAVACATDGDVWRIEGILKNKDHLSWQRIGSGLFQPLGIKVLDEEIYVICRDQLVLLRDFNGDFETDYYESFNHDHQVTDHFHEFAMGLQTDKLGNFYYAKSGRHARESLVPQHGTLLKVSADGGKTDIIAKGFRAANGVCLNPDGSFLVTDQQGFWNPMNRINWVDVNSKAKFYGNMWGYNPPKDSSRSGMEQPMVWLDMTYDRSPSELLWVNSEKWGDLNGKLLSLSYGYGKIQLVFNELVNGQRQGGVIDLPGIKFLTGVMRGRFNTQDGNLYACGMSAWGTSQLMRGGGLYRIKRTEQVLTTPIDLKTKDKSMVLTFESSLESKSAKNPENYLVKTWDLVRSRKYGSERYNTLTLEIPNVELSADGKEVRLFLKGIKPVDVMSIDYDIKNVNGKSLKGSVQNTIHNLDN